MQTSVIPIGNSKGIRIPKSILKQLDIHDKVEIIIHNNELVIKPIKNIPRSGWKDKFEKMHQNKDDNQIISELNDEDQFEWEW